MDDDRIDLSSLDPRRDPARFARLVAQVVTRARQRRSLAVQLAIWARPTLAMAAACAVVAWALVLLVPSRSGTAAPPLLAHWSSELEGPHLQDLIGGDDVGAN
jgi:hypothetical protein